MGIDEFNMQFDVLYNSLTSNQAPGLNVYEKSVLLTKAQDEILKNYFLPQSNPKQAGFDANPKRQVDFSGLMDVRKGKLVEKVNVSEYTCRNTAGEIQVFGNNHFSFSLEGENYKLSDGEYSVWNDNTIITAERTGDTITTKYITVTPTLPYSNGRFIKRTSLVLPVEKLDDRSVVYTYPIDAYIVVNETAQAGNDTLQVMPLRYDEYTRLMSRPYKRPVKNHVWRLFNSSNRDDENKTTKYVELIAGPTETIDSYTVRYIRQPKPIILGSLEGFTINGYSYIGDDEGINIDGECELDPMLHEEILQRAVELAKIIWTDTGQENLQAVLQTGQRSE